MPSKPSPSPEVETLLTGLAFGESPGRHTDSLWFAERFTAFDITADGGLSNRRVWADLDNSTPDGIFVDANHAVLYGDVPNKRWVLFAKAVRCRRQSRSTVGASLARTGAMSGVRCSWR